MKKTKKNKEHDKNLKWIILFVVCVVLIMAMLITYIVVNNLVANKRAQEKEEEVQTAPFLEQASDVKETIEDSANGNNFNLIYDNGGDIDTYNKLSKVVTTFISYVADGDYETAYSIYATELLGAIDYEYTLESFTEDMKKLRDRTLSEDGELFAQCSYYVDYKNYYIVHLALERKTQSDGGIVYENAITTSFTILTDSLGKYVLLDFPYNDFDIYSYRFTSTSEEETHKGITEQGVIVIPELETK